MQQVELDGLVVLKLTTHYQEEGQGTEVVQGVLLGLIVEDWLEIISCFPFPQHTEDDADFDVVQFQMQMIQSIHHANEHRPSPRSTRPHTMVWSSPGCSWILISDTSMPLETPSFSFMIPYKLPKDLSH